ncbi:MAG: beta-N-acetylhexosaminidase [Treponema sp.]|jgi:hexosaminidase|nr:beta-N-acetylhexosaminidase [Treponema sp.]
MKGYDIVPQPFSVEYKPGNFHCAGIPRIAGGSESFMLLFAAQIRKTFGETALAREGGNIAMHENTENFDGDEAYRLEICPEEIIVSAGGGKGIYRGLQTLRQLFLSGFREGALSIPCGIIEDKPRFPWRGFMLDCARHFYSTNFIKNLLDALSLQHINIFHWHLTDDQGWRLPVKGYPLLTEIGSRRQDKRLQGRYVGGYYSEEEIRDVVAFAAERCIEVVPEVDFPGHASSILASYPGLGCTGGPYRVEDRYGIFDDVLCAGSDAVFPLMEAVLDALAEFFPSKYVHIGGDEVRFGRWAECPKCQKRMEELGLAQPPQLQSWITSRLAKMLKARGKTAIGWDEALENIEQFPLPDDFVVMSWRGQEGGRKAAAMGRRVIMAPCTGGCYLDYKHIDDPEEPGQLCVNTITQSYNMEAVTPDMDAAAASLVLGGQGNLWSEIIYAGKIAEYMIFPRICAIAETLWSQKEAKDIDNFAKRLAVHQCRLDRLGLLQYKGPFGPEV